MDSMILPHTHSTHDLLKILEFGRMLLSRVAYLFYKVTEIDFKVLMR